MNKNQHSFPIVRIVGLLSFSGMMLAGVLVNLPPEIVLVRTAIGTGIAILIAQVFTGLIRFQSS